jgi:ubiquinol-cytochrome c reductase cytochrome c subunit
VKSLSTRRRHPLAAFVVLALALAFAGTLFAAFVSPAVSSADSSGETTAQQIADGKGLYAASCSSCHAPNAEGSNLGPSLIGVGAASVDFQVSTGRMPAKQNAPQIQAKQGQANQNIFSPAQIDDMSAYIQSLGGGPDIPPSDAYTTEDGLVALGGVLFRQNCTQCHNSSGEGGALTDGKFAPALTGTTPRAVYEAMLTGPQNMPVFNDAAMSPQDKKAIISFIVASRGAPNYGGAGLGRLGPVSEGLFIWTAGLIVLLLCAVWIAARTTKASAERVAKAAGQKVGK